MDPKARLDIQQTIAQAADLAKTRVSPETERQIKIGFLAIQKASWRIEALADRIPTEVDANLGEEFIETLIEGIKVANKIAFDVIEGLEDVGAIDLSDESDLTVSRFDDAFALVRQRGALFLGNKSVQ